MGGEATFPDGLVCFVHHCLERGISFDFVQATFHVGVNLDGFAEHQASLAVAIGHDLLDESIGLFVRR